MFQVQAKTLEPESRRLNQNKLLVKGVVTCQLFIVRSSENTLTRINIFYKINELIPLLCINGAVMKAKIGILYFVFFFNCFSAKAQYVTIPDMNFVFWLNSNGFTSCLNVNAGLLDTSCIKVKQTKVINCTNANIVDLTGIQYFDSLTDLYCGGNSLISLPNLPTSLRLLSCRYNQLTSLPTLPDSLISFDCGFNQLTNLPKLPITLTALGCDSNLLDSLPALPGNLTALSCGENKLHVLPVLPLMLTYLDCYHNQLTSLVALPDSLKMLSCQGNQLTYLPSLPAGLSTINCTYNQLSSLPALPSSLLGLYCGQNSVLTLSGLPNSLKRLDCSHNQLTSLPILPDSLLDLYCIQNQLTSLPILPTRLTNLDCDENQLTTLPTLPLSLTYLSCNYNQLTVLPALPDVINYVFINNNPTLTCLTSINQIAYEFHWINTGLTCWPNNIDLWWNAIADPLINYLPICDVINTNHCPVNWNISGTIFGDTNINCLVDSGERLFNNVKLNLYEFGLLKEQTISNYHGKYYFSTDYGNYNYFVDTGWQPYIVDCPVSGSYNTIISPVNLINYDKNFSIACKPGYDVGVSCMIRDSGFLRPASYSMFSLLAGDMSNRFNFKCALGLSGTVTIVINGPASFSSVVPGALIPLINGDTLVYNIADFGTVNFQNDFRFIVQTDTTAQIGNQVCFDVTVTPIAGDYDITNNFYAHCFTVVNSFDPNEKEVSPIGATDTSNLWFNYTIYFQNTGNDTAQQIYIIDTLDYNNDESSIQLLSYSHEPMVKVKGKVIRFNFPNINLPDSVSDEPHSHGYVQYKVKRKDNLPVGTQIKNTAYIYFDFNPPVVTNTTVNVLTVPVGVISNNKDNTTFTIYPNPLSSGRTLNLFFNSTSKKAMLNIYEISGREVYSKMILSSNQSQQITLPDLSSGIYQCVLEYDNGIAHQKLVIVK